MDAQTAAFKNRCDIQDHFTDQSIGQKRVVKRLATEISALLCPREASSWSAARGLVAPSTPSMGEPLRETTTMSRWRNSGFGPRAANPSNVLRPTMKLPFSSAR